MGREIRGDRGEDGEVREEKERRGMRRERQRTQRNGVLEGRRKSSLEGEKRKTRERRC